MTAVPPASAVADVLALWDRGGVLTPPLRTVIGPSVPVAGTACTVLLAAGDRGPGLAPLYDLLDGSLDGTTLVIAGAESISGAVWGEILGTAASARDAIAIVLHGTARDVDTLPATPLYALTTGIVGPNGQAQVVGTECDVTIGTTTIRPGDRIVGDAAGCVRVSSAVYDLVLDAATEYAAAEEQMLEAIRSGEPLSRAYEVKREVVARLRQNEPSARRAQSPAR